MDIKSAIHFIVSIENLQSRQDLNNWCKNLGSRQKMYLYIERLAPDHWKRIKTPKDSVRYYYQQLLTNYKIYKGHNPGFKSKVSKTPIDSKTERCASKVGRDKAKRNALIAHRRGTSQTSEPTIEAIRNAQKKEVTKIKQHFR